MPSRRGRRSGAFDTPRRGIASGDRSTLRCAGGDRWGDYIEQANEHILCIGTIEHPAAVDNIDEIAATPGLDIAFIGPGDLAMNLGIPGQYDHPRFKEAIARAEVGLLKSKVALGGVARTAEQAKKMLDIGYRVLVLGGFDWMLLQQAGRNLLDEVRR